MAKEISYLVKMIGRKKAVFLFLVLCCFTQLMMARGNATLSDSTKTKTRISVRLNSAGLGLAEHTAIFDDHLFWGNGKFYFGGRMRLSTRKYWRDKFYSPYSRYNEFKFINEYGLLAGYRVWGNESAKLIVTAGPLLRWEKAREWPDKGSGNAPLLGFTMDRKKGDDMMYYGFMVAAEIGFMKPAKTSGISLFVFSSFANNVFTGGATVSLLLGRF